MFRFLVVPVGIGILVFSIVYFLTPLLLPEADAVAAFGTFVLDLSNSVFTTLPPLLASYLANLNLLAIAITLALLFLVGTQVLVILGDAMILAARAIAFIFRRNPKPVQRPDLPSLDIDARYLKSGPGKKILGGGFDSIDSD